ncbi:MAG: DUF4328 domain-containing protein [Pirellulales bacterium]|nr:DUF4328 domain-containing protein [Pirellulales bacterium]
MDHVENPYDSPKSDDLSISVDTSRGARPVALYRSGHHRAIWAISLLSLCLLASVLGIASTSLQIGFLEKVRSGKFDQQELWLLAQSNDVREMVAGFFQTVTYIASAVTFLLWFFRAYKNLLALGADGLEYSPGWAVGAFFVPILNLFYPYRIMKEIWRHSVPDLSVDPKNIKASSLVGWWWGMFIFMNILAQISMRLNLAASQIQDFFLGSYTSIVSDLFSIIAALLAIFVIRDVERRQDARYRLLAEAGFEKPT